MKLTKQLNSGDSNEDIRSTGTREWTRYLCVCVYNGQYQVEECGTSRQQPGVCHNQPDANITLVYTLVLYTPDQVDRQYKQTQVSEASAPIAI